MHALLQRRGGDLRGRQADAFIDDVHARVARAHRDLLGAVGVPVEARLADEDLRAAPEPLLQARDLAAQLARARRPSPAIARRAGLADAGRGAVAAEHLAQRRAPTRRSSRRRARRRSSASIRFSVARRRARAAASAASAASTAAWSRSARQRRTASICCGFDRRVDDQDAALGVGRQRRVLGLGEAVLARRRPARRTRSAAMRSRWESTSAAFMYGTASTAPPCSATTAISARAPSSSSATSAVHHLRALEDVGVLEDVGFVGQHLLDAQRPLLIPRARQPERLVPRRQLDRAGARVAPERHRERLEHDPLHVVLRLGLGEAERVDLHAVAEAQVARVLRRRSARARAPPRGSTSRAAWRAPRRSARRR